MRSLKGQLSLFDEVREEDPGLDERQVLKVVCRRLVRQAELTPPIDARVLASIRGFAKISKGSQPWMGWSYTLENGRRAVRLRAQDHPLRQRFSLFHEIAHTLLPGAGRTQEFRCVENSKQAREKLANHGAAELLFPKLFFEGDLAWAGLTTTGLEFLARRYQASLEATAIQATEHWSGSAMCLVAKEQPLTAGPIRQSALPPLALSYSKLRGAWPATATPDAVVQSGLLEEVVVSGRVEGILTLDNQKRPAKARVSAKAYPYTADGQQQNRIIALLVPA